MRERWSDELEALEEEIPCRRGWWTWTVLLLLLLAGAGYFGTREYQALQTARAKLAALRAENSELHARVAALEEQVADRAATAARTTAPSPRPARGRDVASRYAPSPSVHVVQAGETFWGIAQRYEVDLSALRKANPDLNQSTLRTGQKLLIPTEGFYVEVKRGETLSGLAAKYAIPVERLVEVNRLKDPNRIPARTRLFIPREVPAP